MAHVLWYETRSFYLASTEATESSTDEKSPSADERQQLLQQLEAEGWEVDAISGSAYGYMNVRRPYEMGRDRASSSVKRLEAKLTSALGTVEALSRRVGGLEEETAEGRLGDTVAALCRQVDSLAPTGQHADFGGLLNVEYPDAEWELTVKGGTRA